MSLARKLLLVALPVCSGGPALAAPGVVGVEVVREIRAEHRYGQTFLTWREIDAPDQRYRIYRGERALRSESDLDSAEFLGEVDDRTSRNHGRTLAAGSERTWVVEDGGQPLDADEGLFVHTVEGPVLASRTRAWYAVTRVRNGVEERDLVSGSNSLSQAVNELAAPPRPVLQSSDENGELYAHWVGDRDTPFQPALAPWPSRGFDFLLERGSAPGPRGLVLSLHAAGQTYSQAWPHRYEAPSDVDLLKPSDLVPYTGWTFWFGAHEDLPGAPGAGVRVWGFTEERLLWTLDHVAAMLGSEHDPERVYVVGGSMGALGGMYLVDGHPERFAAALLRNGLYDLEADDYRNPPAFEELFGAFELGLETRDGLPILQRTNASFMAAREPARDWPVIRTLNGRNDETVGWESAVGLFAGLARAGRPAVHYFDERTHNPNGHWRDLERALLARTFLVRRDRPSLRFDELSLDDDPGDGRRTDGDEVGAINAYVEYDPLTARASDARLDFDVYLRDSGALDDAPRSRATVRMSPCRTGAFRPLPREGVLFSQLVGGELERENLLLPDEHGRLHTPRVDVGRERRAHRFERHVPRASAPLYLAPLPRAGETAQVVLRGAPGGSWTLVVRVGPPRSPLGHDHLLRGTLDERGLAELDLPVPRATPAGIAVLARARIGGEWTEPASATVRAAPPRARPGAR